MASSTPVRDVMTEDVVTIAPDSTPAQAADALAEGDFGAVPVVDASGATVGLLRDEDLLITEAKLHLPTTIAIMPGVEFTLPSHIRRYDEELRQAAASTVADLMEREFPSVAPDATVEDLATLMHQRDVTHVVVLEGGKLVGIVARGDLIRLLATET